MDASERIRFRATDTFSHFHKMVFKEAHYFWRRHGGDRDEIIAEAFYSFLQAFLSYDRTRATFSTWLTYRIRKDLAAYRQFLIEQPCYAVAELDSLPYCERQGFESDAFLSKLGPAAARAASVILEMPSDFKRNAEERGGMPRNFRAALRDWLLQEGYTPAEVTQAFLEIQGAL